MKQKTLLISLSLGCIFGILLYVSIIYSQQQKVMYEAKLDYVRGVQEAEKKWLRQNQGSEGQIYLNYTHNGARDVNPYFACFAVRGFLAGNVSAEDMERVEKYLTWHRARFLEEEGAISNYRLTEGGLLSNGEKDSVDSYTAVFLSLLCKYGEKGGDLEMLDPNGEALLLGLHTLENLWVDGLTTVSQDNQVRYLMDNIEVQAALKDVRNYLDSGRGWVAEEQAEECITKLDKMIQESKDSIEEQLWNKDGEYYEVGLGRSGRILAFESWEELYPAAAVQIYGIAFLQDDGKSKRNKTLYKKFCSAQDWEDMDLSGEEEFGWAVFSYIAALLEDQERAETYLKEYEGRIKEGREYPLHTGEAGWISRTCEVLESEYKEAMDRNIWEVICDWIKEQVV